jgi:TRAP-type C4-dicarboxylate transport system substrate-binding protein
MMKLKRFFTILLAMVVITSVTHASDVTWRATTAYQANSNSGVAFKAMVERLSELSNGSFKLEVNSGGSLGFKNGDNFEVVGDGIVEVAETISGSLIGVDPIFGLLSLPFITSSSEDVQKIISLSFDMFAKVFESNDQKLIGWGSFPAVGIYAEHAAYDLNGIKGLKIRTYDAFGAQALRKLGAAPVQLPWGDVVSSLSSGVIDAVLTSSEGGVVTNIWDLGMTDYSNLGYSTPITLLHISKESFENLSAVHKDAILGAGKRFTEANWEAAQQRIAVNLETLKKHGIKIHQNIDPKLIVKTRELASSFAADWAKKVGPEGKAIADQFFNKN